MPASAGLAGSRARARGRPCLPARPPACLPACPGPPSDLPMSGRPGARGPYGLGRGGAARAPRPRPSRLPAARLPLAPPAPLERRAPAPPRPALPRPAGPAPAACPGRARRLAEPAAVSSQPTSRSPLDRPPRPVPSGAHTRGRARRYIGIGRGGGGRPRPSPAGPRPSSLARRPSPVGRQQPRSCSERRVPCSKVGRPPHPPPLPSPPLPLPRPRRAHAVAHVTPLTRPPGLHSLRMTAYTKAMSTNRDDRATGRHPPTDPPADRAPPAEPLPDEPPSPRDRSPPPPALRTGRHTAGSRCSHRPFLLRRSRRRRRPAVRALPGPHLLQVVPIHLRPPATAPEPSGWCP